MSWLRVVVVLLAWAVLPAAAVTVEQPRSFGHVLGDVLTQRVLLEQPLASAALPATGRIDLWLERRAAHTEADSQGRRWLVIGYQVVNAPRALTAIALPALTLATAGGTALVVPAWPVSIGPLTPEQAFGQGELQPLRPDRAVAPLAVAGLERQLKSSLWALLAVLLAWGGWWAWRNRREAQQLPFAQAWRALHRLDDPAGPQAWRVLHRALNASAGRVVHGAGVSQLLAQAPYLRPLEARLEAFYRESTRRFFAVEAAGPTAACPIAADPTAAYPLKPLARALRDAEKGQQR